MSTRRAVTRIWRQLFLLPRAIMGAKLEDRADRVILLGAAVIVVGIGQISSALATIVAGAFLLLIGILLSLRSRLGS